LRVKAGYDGQEQNYSDWRVTYSFLAARVKIRFFQIADRRRSGPAEARVAKSLG
jgi:hypothetical protein